MTSIANPLRVAVLGCGRMGLETLPQVRSNLPACWLPLSHAEAVVAHPRLELVGLCDPYPEPRQHAAALYPNLPIHEDPGRLLRELQPDLVCIATRTPERTGLIELCLGHGVRLLHLEKPLCRSVAELQHLDNILMESGAHCTFGALRRYLAPYRYAQALVQSGQIGALQEVHVALGFGRLCWTQIHAIDLIAACLAPAAVTEVRALADPTSYSASGALLDGDPLLWFARFVTVDGLQGLIGTSGGYDIFLNGDAGILAVLNDGQEIVLRQPAYTGSPYWTNKQDLIIPEAALSGTAAALDRLVHTNPEAAAADTHAMLKSQSLLLACAQSILENGKPIDPNDLNPELFVTGRLGNLFA